jgi:hypothetical protein
MKTKKSIFVAIMASVLVVVVGVVVNNWSLMAVGGTGFIILLSYL